MPVEGMIGGSVCTHLGAKAKPFSQTDTEIYLFIVIYCPPGARCATWRPIRTLQMADGKM